MRTSANLAPELLPIVERMPVRGDPYADLALTRVLFRALTARAWATYLGEQPGDVPPHAAPLRAADLSRLPPAYVQTCEIDPHRDDGLDYARRLLEAGVSTEIHNVAGAFHAFELLAPHTRLARDTTRLWVEAMHRALVPAAA